MLTASETTFADLTTLRLGGPVGSVVSATSRAALYSAVADLDLAGDQSLLVGGGSNLVVGDRGFPGTVVRVESRGIAIGGSACAGAEVTVEAGESWDTLVARAVDEQWIGIETLSGIPGTVGAVPIQNVGAYGQEVADVIAQVHVWDRRERRTRTIFPADCGFGFRTSIFKKDPSRFVVGAVTFQFRLGDLGAPIRYAELARALGVGLGGRVVASDVRAAVLHLRRTKAMLLDPSDHDTWSAGSFFMNPIMDASLVPDGAPAFPQPSGLVKTSAAWMIERAGFARGYGNDRVRLSTKHALALTNRGDATTGDLLALAREIRDGVDAEFGIRLEPEPTLVGCAL